MKEDAKCETDGRLDSIDRFEPFECVFKKIKKSFDTPIAPLRHSRHTQINKQQIMRTKTFLFTAALLAAGVGASMAQSVFSVNAVGYVNVTLRTGFNLVANPLNGTNNSIQTIMPTAPDSTVLFRFNKATQSYFAADTYFDLPAPDGGWYDGAFAKSTTVINPGEGFFLKNPSGATTLTFVGDVPQGALTNSIGSQYGFYSSIVPQSASLDSLGFPGTDSMNYYSWDAVNQRYNQALTYFALPAPDNGWYDGAFAKVNPTPAVGEGFLIYNPNAAVQWGRTFSVN